MSNPTYVVTQTRQTVVDLLRRRGYMTDSVEATNVEVLEDLLSANTSKQKRSDKLRMNIEHSTDTVTTAEGMTRKKQACVLFLLYPIKNSVTNGKLFEDMLKPESELAKQEPNVSLTNADGELQYDEVLVNYIPAEANEDTAPYDKLAVTAWKKKILVQFFPLGTLVTNPLNHVLQPKFEPVRDEEERKKILKFWYAKSAAQLPMIRFHSDMAARCLGLVPGEFVKITSGSLTAGEYTKYRVCQP